tara:strand:+ start:793 stop:963 length:171 start_codon:yes stop_codon:yes gene_type:complete
MRNDTDGQKDETFYYIVDETWQIFIQAVDMNCNEIGLPVAFHIEDRNAPTPPCAQP